MIQGGITEGQEKFLLPESTLTFKQAMDGLKDGSSDIIYHIEIELAQKLL